MNLDGRVPCMDGDAESIKFEMPGIATRQANSYGCTLVEKIFHHCGICGTNFKYAKTALALELVVWMMDISCE